MIKHILPFLAILLLQLSPAANAQTIKSSPITDAREHRWDLPVAPVSAEKNTDVKGSRLIRSAWAPYANGNFFFRDSSIYQYRPTMGMHPILGWMFDTMTTVRRYPQITRNSTRSLHTFNSAGNITDLEVQWWDSVNNNWYGVSRLKHDYTSGNLLASVQSVFVNGAWIPTIKSEYYTNTIANTSTTLQQQWDVNQNRWIYLQREVTKYNSIGPDSIWKENYVGSSWVREKITAYTYTNGKATLIERTMKTGSGWVPDYKETNTYDNNGQLIETIFQTYNQLGGSWNDPMKEEYSYDANGNRTETISSNWVSGAYQRSSKETVTYNSYKQVLTSTSQTWDANFNQWIYTSNDVQYRYYYEEYTTGINNLSNGKMAIKMYPVPASNMLHVELNEYSGAAISIIDVQGRVVKHLPTAQTQAGIVDISVSDLASGVYLLRVESGYNIAVMRLSIAR